MRHGKKFNHLGRQKGHRESLLSNLATSLILHKRINTTVAKAKALRKYVEPIITRAKDDTTHSRRMVFSYLQDKIAVTELFREVGPKVGDRPGGYTRIIRLENRLGDNAEMCMMELVDYNLIYGNEKSEGGAKKGKTTRRGGKKKSEETTDETAVEGTVEKAPKKTAARKPKAEKPEGKTAAKKKKSTDDKEE